MVHSFKVSFFVIGSTSASRNRHSDVDFEPCSKLEDLNLDIRMIAEGTERNNAIENLSMRYYFASYL